jgi:predicted transcriptional regulator
MRLGPLYKKAEQFEKLQKELPVIIQLSNVKKQDLFRRAGMSESRFYKGMNDKSFTAEQLIKILTAIVEIQNLNTAKIKMQ